MNILKQEASEKPCSVVERCLRAEVALKDVQSLAVDTLTCKSIVNASQ